MARPGKSIAKQSESRAGEEYLPVAGEKVARSQRANLFALYGSREDENMRWVL